MNVDARQRIESAPEAEAERIAGAPDPERMLKLAADGAALHIRLG